MTTPADTVGKIREGKRRALTASSGYKVFYTNTSTYAHLTQSSPSSWSLIPALRHALTKNPEIDYVWSLSPRALITNPSLSLYDHVFSNLTSLMLKDIPVVPPDSVIHTFSHLKPSQVYLILTQDMDNVAHTSFILRNTEAIPVPTGRSKDSWSQYFLDAWFDPLYRAYAFQKAENHALEHIIQWHPTILAKLAIIDQRLLNSYNHHSKQSQDESMTDLPPRQHDGKWEPVDLVVNFEGCVESKERDCEKEMKDYYTKWEETITRLDGNDAAGKP